LAQGFKRSFLIAQEHGLGDLKAEAVSHQARSHKSIAHGLA
jgi:hypothetical protein